MTTERERAVDKARKLRALARDQAETPEGTTAGELYARLAEKWSISEAELLAQEVEVVLYVRPGPETWRIFLLAVVADWFDCQATHAVDTPHSRLYGDRTGTDATADADAYVGAWLVARCAEWRSAWAGWFLATDDDFYMTAVTSLACRFRDLKAGHRPHDPLSHGPTRGEDAPESGSALVADRSLLREETFRRASQAPTHKVPTYEFVPPAEMAAQVLPWPPPPKEGPAPPTRAD